MKEQRMRTVIMIGIVGLVGFFTLQFVGTGNASSPQIAPSTAHFNPSQIYVLVPANGTGSIRCKVTAVDGVWLKCEGERYEWVNTNVMMFASDTR
jgi:hypothetical protein